MTHRRKHANISLCKNKSTNCIAHYHFSNGDKASKRPQIIEQKLTACFPRKKHIFSHKYRITIATTTATLSLYTAVHRKLKTDANTDLDVHLTSPVHRTRPVARLRCYEKGLPKHLLKELLQDINAVGGFNSPRYSLADLRHANCDSYGDSGLHKHVENQVYRWNDFIQEQWTTLLDQYGLLRAPCTYTPAKATSEESEAVLASPVFTSRKTKWKTEPPHQTLCSPFLSSNNTPSMSSLASSMPAQMLAKYKSGDYSKFGACLFSNLA